MSGSRRYDTATSFGGGLWNIVGAAAGGFVVEIAGPGWVFLSNVPMFALAAFAISRMPKGVVGSGPASSVRAEVMAGVRYLTSSPVLLVLLGLGFTRLIFAQPYAAFLPAFARNNLGFDAAGLGLLTSATGVGALLCSLIIASIGTPRNSGKLLIASGIAAAAATALLMVGGSVVSPFIFVILAGVFGNAGDILTRTLVQAISEPAYRGRISSVATIMGNVVILAVLPAGIVADRLGVPVVVGSLALLVIVVHLAAACLLPTLRNLG